MGEGDQKPGSSLTQGWEGPAARTAQRELECPASPSTRGHQQSGRTARRRQARDGRWGGPRGRSA